MTDTLQMIAMIAALWAICFVVGYVLHKKRPAPARDFRRYAREEESK